MTLNFIFISLEDALLHSLEYEESLEANGEDFMHSIYLYVDSTAVGSSYTLLDE